MIYSRPRLVPRPPRRQLRVDILELLVKECLTTDQLSRVLGKRLVVIRAELLVLRHHHVIQRVAIMTHDDDQEPTNDLYYWNCVWELTEHGRSHSDTFELFHCKGCSLRRRSGYALRP